MTDRELLELSYKAANGGAILWADKDMLRNWNPLTNDGDALRLAVKLNLSISHSWTIAESEPLANVIVDNLEQTIPTGEIKGADPYAATRRAIVRAAAEIGRAM